MPGVPPTTAEDTAGDAMVTAPTVRHITAIVMDVGIMGMTMYTAVSLAEISAVVVWIRGGVQ